MNLLLIFLLTFRVQCFESTFTSASHPNYFEVVRQHLGSDAIWTLRITWHCLRSNKEYILCGNLLASWNRLLFGIANKAFLSCTTLQEWSVYHRFQSAFLEFHLCFAIDCTTRTFITIMSLLEKYFKAEHTFSKLRVHSNFIRRRMIDCMAISPDFFVFWLGVFCIDIVLFLSFFWYRG